MYTPPPYWSLSYGSVAGVDDTLIIKHSASSRARSTGRFNSASSSNSNSNSDNSANTPSTVNFAESYRSSVDEDGGGSTSSLCQHLSEEQFDIIDELDYEDVDDMGLIDRELSHRNREALVQQLYNFEQDYLESLDQLVSLFMQPLRKYAQQPSSNFIGMKKIICTEHEIQRLFGNVENILETQREILSTLDLRIYSPYLDNYDNAVTTYERLRGYQPFRKFTEVQPSLKDGMTLLSLLQLPVRAINRHAQRISELADATPPLHPDYVGLRMCRRRVLRLVEEFQTKVDDAENVDRVLAIHRSLSGAPFTIRKGRRLVLQAELSRTHAHSRVIGAKRVYILFSDFLAFARPRQHNGTLQYKGHLNLERALVKLMAREEASGRQYCIGITPLYQGVDIVDTTLMQYPAIHVIQLNNEQEQHEWLEKLTMVINKLNSRADRKQSASSSNSSSSSRCDL
ncbi:Dbl homology domain-containing protein [Zychaea mexicana]|uniref:rho guanine nucleotide exchange factor n=1 Tax=Zychaea mexicana TaxID=64656 RepID=UPI0022FED4D9|nr:rho guanine nucleotide exchange factor [Zychaea mexicana]KAI9499278.1 Dbl homology domain-containing protein [Zychaea mexicana]